MHSRLIILVIITLAFLPSKTKGYDPWEKLRQVFPQASPAQKEEGKQKDPWIMLRALYFPFTEEQEYDRGKERTPSGKLASYFFQKLGPYQGIIRECAEQFQIPSPIIHGVIMVESGGDRYARATESSAKGLMQTIDATFKEARASLQSHGINIGSDPFDPRSSIYAGSWYLDQMYRKVFNDARSLQKENMESWRKPLECYYAGPGEGIRKNEWVIVYSNGKKRRVNKFVYSEKVIRWARILERTMEG